MAKSDTNAVRTTEKSLRLLEELKTREGATPTELANTVDMNISTVHTHLTTLADRGYLFKDNGTYYLGSKLFDLGGYGPGFRIIDALKENGECSVTDLSERLEMNDVVIRAHLNALLNEGYVIESDNAYRLSLQFLDIGGSIRDRMEVYSVSEPKLNTLAEETGELVNLLTEENGKGVYLYQARGENGLELDTYVGFQVHLHATALGKSILAALPDARVTEIIDQWGLPELTPNTISDRDLLFDELETIRDRGVAFDDEERLDGLRCVASPIKTEEGDVLGAISVSAPVSRMPRERFEDDLPEQVRSTVNLIELDINYS